MELGCQGRRSQIRRFTALGSGNDFAKHWQLNSASRSARGLTWQFMATQADRRSPLKPTTFVGCLRRALALTTLRHQPPDLVVLDEFQRYRQIIDEKDTDPLLKALLAARRLQAVLPASFSAQRNALSPSEHTVGGGARRSCSRGTLWN